MKKFEKTGLVRNIERPMQYHFARTDENIAVVSESVAEDPNALIARRSQELGLYFGTLWRISHLDLHLYPYKGQLTIQNVIHMYNGCMNNRR